MLFAYLGKGTMDIPAITTEQMIEVDRLMIEDYGITLMQMMENAGRNLAELAQRQLGSEGGDSRVLVLCGAGNNGGGGMVAARHLHNRGIEVRAALIAEEARLKDVPAHQWAILKKLGLTEANPREIGEPNLILDAMIGYGISGNPRGAVAEWIVRANASGVPILALDAPSGLDATSGRPGEPCIQAQSTMTLALPKVGLLGPEAKPVVGDLFLADISVPRELYIEMGLKVPLLFENGTVISIA